MLPLLLSACEGVADGIYDNGKEKVVKEGQIVVDATKWTEWHYIDLESGTGEVNCVTYEIPRVKVDDTEEGEHPAGMYTYWYDVFGQGLRNNRFSSYYPTARQPEPEHWTFAVHRNNVRTHGGAALRTNHNNISEVPSAQAFANATFTPDSWNENWVWVDQKTMMQGLVGCQGINLNEVLSTWLDMSLPPIPPAFTHDNHVYILRTASGQYAALQLENYMDEKGTKCHLTINYKFPL